MQLGTAYGMAEAYDRGRRYLEAALDKNRILGDIMLEALIQANLGSTAAGLGDYHTAWVNNLQALISSKAWAVANSSALCSPASA